MFTNKQELKDMVMDCQTSTNWSNTSLKIIFLASFIHPCVVTNLKRLFLLWKTKYDILCNVSTLFVMGSKSTFDPTDFHCMEKYFLLCSICGKSYRIGMSEKIITEIHFWVNYA